MGAIVALHLTSKRTETSHNEDTAANDLELKRVKVKANGRDTYKF